MRVLTRLTDAIAAAWRTVAGTGGMTLATTYLAHAIAARRFRQRRRVRPERRLAAIAEHKWKPDVQDPLGSIECLRPSLIIEGMTQWRRKLQRLQTYKVR